MISCYFGVPRVGKNTMATMLAQKGLNKKVGLVRPVKRYDHVYTDFSCFGCEKIDFQKLSKYKIYNSLIIFGEMGMEADNREFKKFAPEIRDFLILHGHLGNDIVYLTQDYSNVDKKIRNLTEELWYLTKSVVPILKEFTIATRIYRKIAINEYVGDLIMGYRFCNGLERIFVRNTRILYRRKWYPYFDSWEEGVLEKRPILESQPWDITKFKVRKRFLDHLKYVIVKGDKVA